MKEDAMPLYEHVFLARQDLAQAQVDALAEAATKIVEEIKVKSPRPKPGAFVSLHTKSPRTVKLTM